MIKIGSRVKIMHSTWRDRVGTVEDSCIEDVLIDSKHRDWWEVRELPTTKVVGF